ncbi:MAG: trehalose-phosphatase [Candidatus Eisenbacteria bacterium]
MPSTLGLPDALEPFVADAETAALFVDFDGSLSPIIDDPARARVLPAARDALARLVPLIGQAAVVSGRPGAFLMNALGIEGLGIAGVYGLERVIDGEVVVDRRVEPWLVAVASAADAAEAALPGLLVERKGRVSVTIHWRGAPDRGPAALAWAEQNAPPLGLDVLPGRMAVELRPPVPVDKGTTVAELARGATVAAFAGDDAGDLPAFAALAGMAQNGELRHAVSIGVASDEGPPAVHGADVVVAGPSGLAALFGRIADAIEGR